MGPADSVLGFLPNERFLSLSPREHRSTARIESLTPEPYRITAPSI
jgi:hypothetical protein